MAEVKNLGGRPSDFDEKKIKKVLSEYLNEAVPQNMKFPTVEGLALKLDVTKKTLYNWTKKSKWFLHSIKRLKMLQKEYLIETGVFGGKEVNPTIIAMMLRVNHKMVEVTKSESKNDLTSNGKELNPILVKFLDADNKHTEGVQEAV